jgi:hypothetical protein
MAITQQGWRAGTSGGGGGLTSLPIENTLYVAKNGDDATGERNRLDKPFLTIEGANTVAQAGDCVYVYAGSYTETGDTFSSAVFYHLEDGVTVINSAGALVRDDGVNAKTINIFGNGRLATSSRGASCVDLTVSIANIECYSISGSNGMILGGACNIIVRSRIVASAGVGISLVNNASGYIQFETLSSSGGESGISANTTTSNDLYIKGRYFSASPLTQVYNLFNSGLQVITFEILETVCLTQSPICDASEGNYIFKNGLFNQTTISVGFQCVDTKIDFINCIILQSTSSSFNIKNVSSTINLIQCNLDSFAGINIICDQESFTYIQDSVLNTDNRELLGANIRTSGTAPTLVIANSQLINGQPFGGGQFSILAQNLLIGETLDIRIQGICVATFPISTQIVNLITGTNIIADTDAITVPRNKLP